MPRLSLCHRARTAEMRYTGSDCRFVGVISDGQPANLKHHNSPPPSTRPTPRPRRVPRAGSRSAVPTSRSRPRLSVAPVREAARADTEGLACGVRSRILFGIGGAVVGFALYVTFALATGLIIGWVSVAVGYIVGKAMHMGSRGVGGRRYQVVAVLLTYFAVRCRPCPLRSSRSDCITGTQAQETARPQARTPVSLAKTVAVLTWVGIASPILDLRIPCRGSSGWSFCSWAALRLGIHGRPDAERIRALYGGDRQALHEWTGGCHSCT